MLSIVGQTNDDYRDEVNKLLVKREETISRPQIEAKNITHFKVAGAHSSERRNASLSHCFPFLTN